MGFPARVTMVFSPAMDGTFSKMSILISCMSASAGFSGTAPYEAQTRMFTSP